MPLMDSLLCAKPKKTCVTAQGDGSTMIHLCLQAKEMRHLIQGHR